MSDPITRAQIVLLARTLHVPPERLAHLKRLGAEQVHEIQQRMAAVLFDRHAETFGRISRLVPIIPLTISIPLVQRLVPPMLTGRAAGAVGVEHPKKAAETLALLDPSYAADCAPYLDPRSVGELADVAPPEPVVGIVNEILRRGDYVTAGPFLAYATPPLIEAVERGVHDDAGLIFSAAYAYSADAVSAIVRQLLVGTQHRVPGMIRTVLIGPPELQTAALTVFARCEPDAVAAVGDILFTVGSAAELGGLIETAIRVGAVPQLLAVAGRLGPDALARLAALPILAHEPALRALITALDGDARPDSWRGLFAALGAADTELRLRAARLLAGLSPATLADLPAHATEADIWASMLDLLATADAEVRAHIGAVWATLPPERRAGLHWHLADHRDDPRLNVLVRAIPAESVEEVFFKRRRQGRRRG
ncbi:hypothetical protein NDR87_35655 [Nocardia sp. CDC159]|uniref:Uncharacterized protein n=1 Tax=Nocardia pulmonis TaxID=2951408 RepID=A0A9X2J262_9NOCA|nr:MULTISPECIES: hypothetical protein [Nocardia]MCM6778825.1 hypothetical protein [Nocardia pulmonis]MCM6791714.1 hypothetical protein [Nocardia sp. CDC159]